MPVDMLGAVTIYHVAALNNGFFVWPVLASAPASHARPLHAPEAGCCPSPGPWLRLLGLPLGCGGQLSCRVGGRGGAAPAELPD